VREGKKKGWSFLVGHFYTTLNLEVGKQYIKTWLLSPVGQGEDPLSQEGKKSQTTPNLACLKFPLKGSIPKILFGRLLKGGVQGAVEPIYQEYCPFPIAVPRDLNSDICV
jgi:hypothetical protein